MDAKRPPVPESAQDLLARSDAELVAASFASEPGGMLLHAHLAALRAGAALVRARGRPGGRPAPRTVWEMVAVITPELAGWAAYFADTAALRAAVEAGRGYTVGAEPAERALGAAEDFQHAVRGVLGLVGRLQARSTLRAS